MDPNLFHIDYERLFEALVTIVVFSFLIERALSIFFESRFFIDRFEGGRTHLILDNDSPGLDDRGKTKGIKEVIAFIVSVACCLFWKFDAFTIVIVSHSEVTIPGMVLTGAVIAGGSKASVKLFRDVLGFMSTAEKERQEREKEKKRQ